MPLTKKTMTSENEKMKNAISHYEKELSSLRTSRANPKMLDNILVEGKDGSS